MVHNAKVLAAMLSLVALAGCTGGGDGGGSDDGTTTGSGGGVGGNVTVGNGTVGGNVSASSSMTNSSTNASAPAAPDTAEVSIEDNEFVNATVTIAAGGTVTWTHNGDNPHTVTADDDSFDSSPDCGSDIPLLPPNGCLEQGATFSWTFTEPGTYTYHCKVHDGMTGTVVVVDQ